MSVGEGIKCGMILMEVKSIVGHGNFTDWVKANAKISQKVVTHHLIHVGVSHKPACMISADRALPSQIRLLFRSLVTFFAGS